MALRGRYAQKTGVVVNARKAAAVTHDIIFPYLTHTLTSNEEKLELMDHGLIETVGN